MIKSAEHAMKVDYNRALARINILYRPKSSMDDPAL
jgi:hypothetical protein